MTSSGQACSSSFQGRQSRPHNIQGVLASVPKPGNPANDDATSRPKNTPQSSHKGTPSYSANKGPANRGPGYSRSYAATTAASDKQSSKDTAKMQLKHQHFRSLTKGQSPKDNLANTTAALAVQQPAHKHSTTQSWVKKTCHGWAQATALWLNATWMGSKCRLALKHSLPSPPLTSHPCVPASLPPSERTLTAPSRALHHNLQRKPRMHADQLPTPKTSEGEKSWLSASEGWKTSTRRVKTSIRRTRRRCAHTLPTLLQFSRGVLTVSLLTIANAIAPHSLSICAEQGLRKFEAPRTLLGRQVATQSRVLLDKHSLQRLQALCNRCLQPSDSNGHQA